MALLKGQIDYSHLFFGGGRLSRGGNTLNNNMYI